MKLKYNRQVSNSTVTVVLMLSNMTTRERRAIKTLGSPSVKYEEAYEVSGTTVDIDTTIDKFNELGAFTFKADVESIGDVLDEVASFIAGIHETLTDVMSDLMLSYKEIEAIANDVTGEIGIVDGVCHPDNSGSEIGSTTI